MHCRRGCSPFGRWQQLEHVGQGKHYRRGCRLVRCASVPERSFRFVGLCRVAWAFLFKRKRTRRLLAVIITDGASPSIVFLIKAARMANSSFRTPHPRMAPSETAFWGLNPPFFVFGAKKLGKNLEEPTKSPTFAPAKAIRHRPYVQHGNMPSMTCIASKERWQSGRLHRS